MITVTKIFSFCYGHSLPQYEGKCVNLHGHGSKLEVEFTSSKCEKYPGMALDFNTIKKEVGAIAERIDHQHLNEFLPPIYQPPTIENITKWFVDEILYVGIGENLVRVRVWESDTSYAEWKKEV